MTEVYHGMSRSWGVKFAGAVRASTVEIDLSTASDGTQQLREGGLIPLWAAVERAYERWLQWRQPSWVRFGLAVTTDTQVVWLDDPDNVLQRSDHPANP